jgi:hypothetical protein
MPRVLAVQGAAGAGRTSKGAGNGESEQVAGTGNRKSALKTVEINTFLFG